MINSPTNLLIWTLLSFVSALPLASYVQPNNRNWTGNDSFEARIRELLLPETEAIERDALVGSGDSPRSRREVELEDLGLDTVSFEVPTIMRLNESRVEEPRVNLLPVENGQPAAYAQGSHMDCLPKLDKQTPMPKPPIVISMCIDNIIPPGKADKFMITNSSEIRGCSLMMKINLFEKRATTPNPSNCNPADLVFSFDIAAPTTKSDRLEPQNKKKTECGQLNAWALPATQSNISHYNIHEKSDEEEEEEDSSEQKVIQEVLRKILAGKVNSTTLPPEELPAFLRNSSREPFTLILNPSLLHKISTKLESTTSHWPTTFNYRSPNPPDYDYLYKVVEQLSSNIPKQKLTALLSSIIAKSYPAEK